MSPSKEIVREGEFVSDPPDETSSPRRPVKVYLWEEEQSKNKVIYNRPDVAIGDTEKDAKIKTNMSKNAELEEKIAAM